MKVYISSPRGKEKLVEEFSKHAEVVKSMDSDVKLIIPTVDEELPFFAQAKQWFLERGVHVMVGSDYAIYEARDKAEFARFCARHGFCHPMRLQGDFIAKPRFGKGSRGIIKLNSSYIIQPLLEGPEVSIDYFSDWEGNPLSILPRYRLNVENGESKSYCLVEGMDLTEVKRLGKELGLIGHNVIQGFYIKGKMCFTEVNPRFGGGSWMTFPHFNSPQWLVESILDLSHSK